MTKIIFLPFYILFLGNIAFAQCDYYEDFEGTLSDWQVNQGTSQITGVQPYAGSASLQMNSSSDYTQVLNNNVMFGYGTYTCWFYVTGPTSDAYFHFQYLDSDNQYYVAMQPLSTDNPNLTLRKIDQGQMSILAQTSPIFSTNSWFKLTVDRTADGFINVYINDLLQQSVFDQSLTESGRIMVMGYDETVYVDDICYEAIDVTSVLEQNNEEVLVDIYPNPSLDGIFEVKFTEANPPLSKEDITLYNNLGSVIDFSFHQNKIDISDHAKGVYFLSITTPNKETVVKKLVRN
ncbi:MAG: T9SS type A sorting domain-containing protein [bacterium]|nr:T9SS type A sorting domain-containing protein [bacterium]